MSDIRRLKEKLAKISAGADLDDQGGRILEPSNEGGFLGAFLNEIDETVLARKLTFKNEAGSTLGFDVANRRLLRLSDRSGPADVALCDTLMAKSFSHDSGHLIDALFSFLEKFFENSNSLIVRSDKPERSSDPSEIGCSSATLAQAWSLNLYNGPESIVNKSFEEFASSCEEDAIAWVRYDEEKTYQTSGPEDDQTRLIELSKSDTSGLEDLLKNSLPLGGSTRCAIVESSGEVSQSILFIIGDQMKALMLFPSDNLPDIHSRWGSA